MFFLLYCRFFNKTCLNFYPIACKWFAHLPLLDGEEQGSSPARFVAVNWVPARPRKTFNPCLTSHIGQSQSHNRQVELSPLVPLNHLEIPSPVDSLLTAINSHIWMVVNHEKWISKTLSLWDTTKLVKIYNYLETECATIQRRMTTVITMSGDF